MQVSIYFTWILMKFCNVCRTRPPSYRPLSHTIARRHPLPYVCRWPALQLQLQLGLEVLLWLQLQLATGLAEKYAMKICANHIMHNCTCRRGQFLASQRGESAVWWGRGENFWRILISSFIIWTLFWQPAQDSSSNVKLIKLRHKRKL